MSSFPTDLPTPEEFLARIEAANRDMQAPSIWIVVVLVPLLGAYAWVSAPAHDRSPLATWIEAIAPWLKLVIVLGVLASVFALGVKMYRLRETAWAAQGALCPGCSAPLGMNRYPGIGALRDQRGVVSLHCGQCQTTVARRREPAPGAPRPDPSSAGA